MENERAEVSIPFRPLREGADFERFIGEFTNYERMKDYRYAADTMSLERMEGLARELGDPQEEYRTVHIAGTKGKGTTCLMLESLLSASGNAVGTYTSPHVEHLCERIRFAGASIAPHELCALTNSILPGLERRYQAGPSRFPTFFELMTALAMLDFHRRRADWGLFEVGLGGRLDATNILRPRWTAISSLGLEHTDKLGSTLPAIAREKAGIVKPGTPLVLGRLPPAADEVVRAVARERGAPVVDADPDRVRPAGPGSLTVEGPGMEWSARTLPAGVVRGPGLRADLSLALELWRGALAEDGSRPEFEPLREALSTLRLPARVEVFEGNPPVVIDGAHTPESVKALRLALEEIRFPRPRGLVFALTADKPLDPILRELPGLAEETVFTLADPARGSDPARLAAACSALLGLPARAVEDPLEAFRMASGKNRAVVVTGSFYLAGKLRPLVRRPPSQQR